METARHHVVTRVAIAHGPELASAVIDRLVGASLDLVDPVFVVDDDGRLRGTIPLTAVLAAGDQRCDQLLDREAPRVGLRTDQEHVAAAARRGAASAVAVLDDDHRLVGAVPPRALLDILHREHVEDLHRLAGIRREVAGPRGAREEPPARRARHRLPWLLVGLAGSMGAALLMSRFEHVLSRSLEIAFFVPAIVYLADAIGTQTETITVRGLSLSQQPLGRLFGDELRTGLLIGVTLAVLAWPVVTLMFGDPRLATAVAGAIVVAGAFATSIGLLLPTLLARAGSDPALGSGPLATIIQDVLSLLIYFAFAALLMR